MVVFKALLSPEQHHRAGPAWGPTWTLPNHFRQQQDPAWPTHWDFCYCFYVHEDFLLVLIFLWMSKYGLSSCTSLEENTNPVFTMLWESYAAHQWQQKWGMVPHPQHWLLYIVIYRMSLVEFEVSHLESRQKQVLILHQNTLSLLTPTYHLRSCQLFPSHWYIIHFNPRESSSPGGFFTPMTLKYPWWHVG